MKIVLLGAMGFVGQVAARELAGRPEVRELLLVDYNIREAKKFARALSPKCRCAMADVSRVPDLERLLEDVDAVANAAGPCSEFEKTVLLTCAGSGRSAASIGDNALSAADRREVHEAFRRAGAGGVSGCGMYPGWTDLLAAHFLPKGSTGNDGRAAHEEGRFFFCSPDRFGGYAFFRRFVGEIGRPTNVPSCAPAGCYFEAGRGTAFGLPEGKPAGRCRRLIGGLGLLGPVGRELSAAFLFWLRGSLRAATGVPAAAAGVFPADVPQGRFAAVTDPEGRLAGTLLAETVLLLGRERGKGKGLLPLPEILGKEEARRIASSCSATVTVDPLERA
ncbi:MAG: saccharopine dehydrogenase NADP-binding domain-containing protein [Thermodesulfobacteriota bacterium]|nr:saccharopine dehydrogenase NADP-binding domain-containing protein [Thermodesulfobacteriota bacterium]